MLVPGVAQHGVEHKVRWGEDIGEGDRVRLDPVADVHELRLKRADRIRRRNDPKLDQVRHILLQANQSKQEAKVTEYSLLMEVVAFIFLNVFQKSFEDSRLNEGHGEVATVKELRLISGLKVWLSGVAELRQSFVRRPDEMRHDGLHRVQDPGRVHVLAGESLAQKLISVLQEVEAAERWKKLFSVQ